ncbi:MAG: hypothetical protein A3K68_01220 [Euryarchaeota archaeon RBG_16_68_13]|nr:MAG: hypothetical protein A3K68_01220 [Euryarchaeota archaeon RBG_16_68_13]
MGRGLGPGTGGDPPALGGNEEHAMRPKTPALSIVVLGLLLALPILSGPGGGTDPVVVTNPDGTKTVTWSFVNGSYAGSSGLVFGAEGARLDVQDEELSLDTGSDFEASGDLGLNFSAEGDRLELRANESNRMPEGTFDTSASWSYETGGGNTTASWDAGAGVLAHASSAAPVSPFDTFDHVVGWWNSTTSGDGSTSIPRDSLAPDRKEGSGMMDLEIQLQSSTSYAGVWRSISAQNWSVYDRLLVWIMAPSSGWEGLSTSVWLQTTGGAELSPAVPLAAGWQELVIDLDSIPIARDAVVGVQLRFSDMPPFQQPIFLGADWMRLSRSKDLSEWASISGSFEKDFDSSSDPWSARFAFDWRTASLANVTSASLLVNVSGLGGFREVRYPATQVGGWTRFLWPAGELLAERGTYRIAFEWDVTTDTVYAASADMRIDNVTILIPDIRGAVFTSRPLDVPLPVTWLSALGIGAVPPGTYLGLEIRFGNASDDSDLSWTGFEGILLGTPRSLSALGLRYAQFRVTMDTSNSSESPALDSLSFAYRRHVASGQVDTSILAPGPSLLGWRRFLVDFDAPAGGAGTFELRDGIGPVSVLPGGDLSSFDMPSLQVRVTVRTANGSVTPTIRSVSILYESLGPLVRMELYSNRTSAGRLTLFAGETETFSVAAFDEYDHPLSVPFLSWSTTDDGGRVQNGVYRAGNAGTWYVNATSLGGVTGSVLVTVRLRDFAALPLEWIALLAAGVSAVAYAAYVTASRRLFATDDVFVIAKDGRLMMHNTRRLRADRDEDVFAGMLTAINAFVRDSFREENGSLRRFEFEGKTVLLERGAHVVVAAIHTGRVPGWAAADLRAFVRDLEARFGAAFLEWNGSPEDLVGLKEFTGLFVSRTRYRAGNGIPRRAA